ncbi:histidine phosphatase family protein [Sterolibacterium denitrificans]|nr:histidine phosphatase family protein [Sterolibacterium denitrificans]
MNGGARLCIARHGETDWNAAGILQGWSDVPLNAAGRAQAQRLAADFSACGFVAVWSSPLLRALETASIIADRLGLPPPRCHDGLKERHFGIIQGVPKIELAELNPLLLQQILKRNPAAEFVDGESMDEFADRVLAALGEIAAQPGPLLVITHGWVLDVVTRQLRGLPRDALLGHKPGNGECLWLDAVAVAEKESAIITDS